MKVTGVVTFSKHGEAVLRLQPAMPTTVRVPEQDTPLQPPSCDEVQNRIRTDAWEVHASRLPLAADSVKIMVSNTQQCLSLRRGPQGGWSEEAWAKLRALMAKAKRERKSTTQLLSLLPPQVLDNNGALALEDAQRDENEGNENKQPDEKSQDDRVEDKD